MDEMNVSNWLSTKWFKEYSNWLPLVQWAGWIIVTLLLAKMFWLWVLYFTTPTDFKPMRVTSRPAATNASKVDVSAITSRDIFGSLVKAPTSAPVVETPQQETRLKLKLRGIYAADTVSKANAIIEDGRGKQAVYFIGDKLEVSGRVYLRQVQVDKVILETNGKREFLKLEQEELAIVTSKSKSKRSLPRLPKSDRKVSDKRKNQRLSKKLMDYKEKLLADPKSVADVINGRPHFVDGELKGFRIQPGKDRRLFQELGLRPNDLVTSINGVGLTNMQDAMTLMGDAQSMSELNVEIQRGNEQLSLLLNLNEKVGR